jgi:hypothetical protein
MYIGAIENEQEAAQLYDKIAILVHGLKVNIFYINFLNRQKQISTIHYNRYQSSLMTKTYNLIMES